MDEVSKTEEKTEPGIGQQLTKVVVATTVAFIVGKLVESGVDKAFSARRNHDQED